VTNSNLNSVYFLVKHNADLNQQDRWGKSPINYAELSDDDRIYRFLSKDLLVMFSESLKDHIAKKDTRKENTNQIQELIDCVARGDLVEFKRLMNLKADVNVVD